MNQDSDIAYNLLIAIGIIVALITTVVIIVNH